MEYEKIKQLMEDMGNSKLTSINIDFPDGTKISMKKENIQEIKREVIKQEQIIESKAEEQETKIEETGKIVKSPMVGTFYLKPAPDANPYVEVGKEVQKGDILCIIEAMKLMNEMESEYNGKIKEILVKDGEPVEFGMPLFVIE